MGGAQSLTLNLVDPDVQSVGIDPGALVAALKDPSLGPSMIVPGIARHPELITAAVRSSGVARAVVVTADLGSPPISELRTWGQAGGLAPLGVHVVALDILSAGRSADERLAYAVRMVRAGGDAGAAGDDVGASRATRRSVGASLSRRGLLKARATTWVPVVEVDPSTCLGTVQCGRCVDLCPEDALKIRDDGPHPPPVVDLSRCEACSGCLDVCPTDALSLDGHDSETLAHRLRALLRVDHGAPVPALVICCQDAAEPLHRLGERSGLPGWIVLDLACLGGVGSTWYLAALAAGAPTVQVLPCARCRERGTLTGHLDFTVKLLAALGDVAAARRVGILPAAGSPLRRAIRAAADLAAPVDGTAAHPIPMSGTTTGMSARVAAWAIGELEDALAGEAPDRDRLPRVIEGDGAPLGVVRAAPGCTACGVCARTCPTRALSLAVGSGSTELVLDPAACNGCGICHSTCPERVLEVVRGVDLGLLASGCTPIATVASPACPDCGDHVSRLPAGVLLPSLPAELVGRCPPCRQAALIASV